MAKFGGRRVLVCIEYAHNRPWPGTIPVVIELVVPGIVWSGCWVMLGVLLWVPRRSVGTRDNHYCNTGRVGWVLYNYGV